MLHYYTRGNIQYCSNLLVNSEPENPQIEVPRETPISCTREESGEIKIMKRKRIPRDMYN